MIVAPNAFMPLIGELRAFIGPSRPRK